MGLHSRMSVAHVRGLMELRARRPVRASSEVHAQGEASIAWGSRGEVTHWWPNRRVPLNSGLDSGGFDTGDRASQDERDLPLVLAQRRLAQRRLAQCRRARVDGAARCDHVVEEHDALSVGQRRHFRRAKGTRQVRAPFLGGKPRLGSAHLGPNQVARRKHGAGSACSPRGNQSGLVVAALRKTQGMKRDGQEERARRRSARWAREDLGEQAAERPTEGEGEVRFLLVLQPPQALSEVPSVGADGVDGEATRRRRAGPGLLATSIAQRSATQGAAHTASEEVARVEGTKAPVGHRQGASARGRERCVCPVRGSGC